MQLEVSVSVLFLYYTIGIFKGNGVRAHSRQSSWDFQCLRTYKQTEAKNSESKIYQSSWPYAK